MDVGVAEGTGDASAPYGLLPVEVGVGAPGSGVAPDPVGGRPGVEVGISPDNVGETPPEPQALLEALLPCRITSQAVRVNNPLATTIIRKLFMAIFNTQHYDMETV